MISAKREKTKNLQEELRLLKPIKNAGVDQAHIFQVKAAQYC